MKTPKYGNGNREAATTGLAAAAVTLAAVVAVLGASALIAPAKAASTVSFSCLPQAQAQALIQASPPGSMWPDTSTCVGMYDGYYTPSATATSATSTTSTSTASIVTGMGTIAAKTNTTANVFFPAPGSTTASPLYVGCNGTTSSPTTTNAPYVITTASSSVITGIFSTSTGSEVGNSLNNPCAPNPDSTRQTSGASTRTYTSVTLTLPNGQTFTGGLVISAEYTANTIQTSSTTSTGTTLSHITVSGTDGLAGLTGTGLVITNSVTLGSVRTAATDYWVQLTSIP